MKARPQMSLAEMASRAAGVGRLSCPRCGCGDFRTEKTQQGVVVTFRHKICRHCGTKIYTKQPPEQFVRFVETRGGIVADEEIEGDLL